MNRVGNTFKPMAWLTALLLATSMAGCGGAGDSADTGTKLLASTVVVASVAEAPGDSSANPTVASAIPRNGATNVPTSINSSDNIVTGTVVSATFSVPMDPATLNSSHAAPMFTFTVRQTDGGPVHGTVAMNAINTVASFTPVRSALRANTRYTATVSTGAKSADGTAMDKPVVWTFMTKAIPFTSQAPVNLGSAGNFVLLSKTGISTVPNSALTGDIGVSPIAATAITGFSVTVDSTNTFSTSPQVVGKIYAADYATPTPTYMTAAIGDMEIAYRDADGRKLPDFTELGTGEIGGMTLAPGLYKWSGGVTISSDVTLSGGPDDIWIFQIAGTISQAVSTRVTLAGGALPKNIFWQPAGSVALGVNSHFEGIILAKTLIAMKTGASANGRLLAQTAITLDQNAVTQPAP